MVGPGEKKEIRMKFQIPKALPSTDGHYIDCAYVMDILAEVSMAPDIEARKPYRAVCLLCLVPCQHTTGRNAAQRRCRSYQKILELGSVRFHQRCHQYSSTRVSARTTHIHP